MKQETASSTRSTLHLSRLSIWFQCIEGLFQYLSSEVMSNTPFHLDLAALAYNTSFDLARGLLFAL